MVRKAQHFQGFAIHPVRDEGSPALDAIEVSIVDQFIDGFPDGHAAGVELVAELLLGGDDIPFLVNARFNVFLDVGDDLLVYGYVFCHLFLCGSLMIGIRDHCIKADESCIPVVYTCCIYYMKLSVIVNRDSCYWGKIQIIWWERKGK